MALTLATEGQILLGIGLNATAAQISGANILIWGNYAESEMSKAAQVDLVANYATINTYLKQWLAKIAVAGASIEAINQNPNAWNLSVTQDKKNVHTNNWERGLKDLEDRDVIARLGL